MAKAKTSVTLHFRNKQERDYFMGQLSDGWGENHIDLYWNTTKEFHECVDFKVFLGVDDYDDMRRHEELKKKRLEKK